MKKSPKNIRIALFWIPFWPNMSRTEFSANLLEKQVSFSSKILKQCKSGKSYQLLLRKMLN